MNMPVLVYRVHPTVRALVFRITPRIKMKDYVAVYRYAYMLPATWYISKKEERRGEIEVDAGSGSIYLLRVSTVVL